jgi:uncharacterized protein
VLKRESRALLSAMLAFGLLLAGPAQAQFSNSYEFLKAVEDRDVGKAQRALTNTGGSIINTRNPDTGDTALHIAVKRSDAAWMRFLLDNGANPSAQDGSGETAMHIVAVRGYADGLRVLLAYKGNINALNDNGETPLIKAVQNRQELVVRLLLDAGARTDIADSSSGYTAIDHAERDRRAGRILAMLREAQAKK